MGMSWELIEKYSRIIQAIATKYTGDQDLQQDVVQEVKLRLASNPKLDVNKFNPQKRDAAIRNTIRNQVIKVLKSKRLGRWKFESLEGFERGGGQVDSQGNVIYPDRAYWNMETFYPENEE
jgi:DNA-directed RNA polymerase specialized sigma24 family protein